MLLMVKHATESGNKREHAAAASACYEQAWVSQMQMSF